MARTKLELQQEIEKYIGLPYSKNILKDGKIIKEQFLGGKGNCRQIATETIRLAQKQKIDLTQLNNQEFYNFQKKNHIGIDCSGLACQLLNFYFNSELNPRKTSANMLTSAPISQEIKPSEIKTGDLVRQKNGHHILFIIEKQGNVINYVDSSISGRGVKYGQTNLTDKSFINQGFFRLN
ncbi:MAG: NlpC/P60 family protein [Candidatus Shapirobacteria bacterium]|nr:NlpC/P60 family protein [Candidatus Shapirobacteria bacterium]MDD4383265.1 NlpC/P60 family protein [Candidatus Shapirobacteria bacterium]